MPWCLGRDACSHRADRTWVKAPECRRVGPCWTGTLTSGLNLRAYGYVQCSRGPNLTLMTSTVAEQVLGFLYRNSVLRYQDGRDETNLKKTVPDKLHTLF